MSILNATQPGGCNFKVCTCHLVLYVSLVAPLLKVSDRI